MITTALLGLLVVSRAVAGAAGVARGRLAVLDRLLVPAGVAFVALLALRLVDLWLGNG